MFIDILHSFCYSLFIFLPSWLLICYRFWSSFSSSTLLFIKTSKIVMRFNIFLLKFSEWKYCYVLLSMKHFYQLTSKINHKSSLTLIILCNLYMSCKSSGNLRMLDATFGVWLWPLLNRGSMSGHFFCKQIFKRNINNCQIVMFCVWTSHPQNVLNFTLFVLKQYVLKDTMKACFCYRHTLF